MNVDSIKRRLLVKYPFFGSVVANSNFIAEPAVGTAGTDGKTIYYNPNFIESITDDQQTFIFAHEICHIAFDHIFRSEGKDKDLWNIATDSVVNAFLKQDGLPIVEGGIDIPEAINYDAEEMYKKIVAVDKLEKTNNNHNLNNKVILVLKIHKNKRNNHKNKVVVDQSKIHRKKKNNKMLDMTLILCGIKQ